MGSHSDSNEWQYAETVRATCPSCEHTVAIETGVTEFTGARCLECNERMETEYR